MSITITLVIIGITTLISFYGFNNQNVISQLIMNPYQVQKQNEYYRFVTSGFIHQDHVHLLFNMFSLYFFGTGMEQVFTTLFGTMGYVYFIALYLLGIIVSDVPSYFKHKNDRGYSALGASGGVASVIFAFIIFLPLEDICFYAVVCIPGFIAGTAYILFSWYQGRKANDNINHDAHLYGAFFGIIFCAVLYPPAITNFFQQIIHWKVLERFF